MDKLFSVVSQPNYTESYLEEDKATKPQHFPFHGAIEVSFLPKVHGRKYVRKSNQPTPHSMTPLHVKDKLKLWQSHVMVHSGKMQIKKITILNIEIMGSIKKRTLISLFGI